MKKAFAAVCLLVLAWGSPVLAQDKLKVEPAPVGAAADVGGIKSQNILDVKPDASADAGYATQTNAERAKVQPGNNAPVWRQVSAGVTGFASLPYPEAGNLIQPFVQYPGSRVTNAGEAWRQVRNDWIIPYGGSLLIIAVGALAIFYMRKGAIALPGAPPRSSIERFTPLRPSSPWANAVAFPTLSTFVPALALVESSLFPWHGRT